MVKVNENYVCNICGNLVQIIEAGGGELVCCNQPMKLVKDKINNENIS